MLFLIIDFETSGLSVKEDRITEIGAVLYDPILKMPIQTYNCLVKIDRPLTPEITRITGLTDDILNKYGKSFYHAVKDKILVDMFCNCTHVMAHNGTNFDKPFYIEECIRNNTEPFKRPWIDSSIDVPYPEHITTRKLSYLALEHGYFTQESHRAVFDCMALIAVISKYDPLEIVKWSESPSVKLRAMVSFDERAKASGRGYRWDAYNKVWIKTVKDFQLDKEIAECGFKTEVLK